jgi:hypothetical protein
MKRLLCEFVNGTIKWDHFDFPKIAVKTTQETIIEQKVQRKRSDRFTILWISLEGRTHMSFGSLLDHPQQHSTLETEKSRNAKIIIRDCWCFALMSEQRAHASVSQSNLSYKRRRNYSHRERERCLERMNEPAAAEFSFPLYRKRRQVVTSSSRPNLGEGRPETREDQAIFLASLGR